MNPNKGKYWLKTKWFFSWHHGNIPRMECQTKLEKAFLSSVKVAGRPVNTWLVRLSRNNEQTISICFAKKKVHEGREQVKRELPVRNKAKISFV